MYFQSFQKMRGVAWLGICALAHTSGLQWNECTLEATELLTFWVWAGDEILTCTTTRTGGRESSIFWQAIHCQCQRHTLLALADEMIRMHIFSMSTWQMASRWYMLVWHGQY